MSQPTPAERANLKLIREHVEAAHLHVRQAQDLAYGNVPPWEPGAVKPKAPRKVRFALNSAQSTLIKLLVHVLVPGTKGSIRRARDTNDEKHIAPLQLPLIERCVRLWSNPGELVCSPFAGIGSEGHVALKHGRRFVGCELIAGLWLARLAQAFMDAALGKGRDA